MAANADILPDLLKLNNLLIAEKDFTVVIENIMDTAANICNADCGFFYTLNDDNFLSLNYSFNKSQRTALRGSDNLTLFQTVYLPERKTKNPKSVVETCYFNNEVVNTANLYGSPDLDNSFFVAYDETNAYRTISVLTLPIVSRKENIVGIAQFVNPQDYNGKTVVFTSEMQKTVQSVLSLAGLVLENRRMNEAYGQLLESFIEVLARAIDAKSPYTGAHCQRVPVIARLLATAAVQEESGPLRNFEMSPEDWYALHIASWLHDCNIGDAPLTDDDIQRLERLSKIKFIRYFNRMLGLSWAERDNVRWPELYERPSWENLLQNRDDHIFGQYNRGELYNLEIRQGTINKEEREKINEHIVVTIDMLKALPFPKELSKVVEYAGAHHERVDGKGYPNGLTGDEMSVPAKIMAIADIFEALTANDRPYKEPKKLSEVLRIMQEMKNTGHIDPDLYKVFITGKVYMDYAEQYISPQQIDEINPDDYL